MKVCICMMQKNEFDLFPLWVEYHGNLFGYKNLYVFDNGSEESMRALLGQAELKGVNVIYDLTTFDDFQEKGRHISKLIKKMDSESPADFYFPLDCDEFIGVEQEGRGILVDKESITEELAKHNGSQEVLLIGCGYDNHPVQAGVFSRKTRRKCFFARDTCVKLSLGFHTAKVKRSDKEKKTAIVYMHLHYKPLILLREHSIQKLVGRVSSFSVPQLILHRNMKLRGSHLVDALFFRNDADYLHHFETTFTSDRYRVLNAFQQNVNGLRVAIAETWPKVSGSGEKLMMRFRASGREGGITSFGPECLFTEASGYGWVSTRGLKKVDRKEFGYPDYEELLHGREAQTFRMKLPPGLYRVEIQSADPKGVARTTNVQVDAHAILPVIQTSGKSIVTLGFDVTLPEAGNIDIHFSSPEGVWSLSEVRLLFTSHTRPPQCQHRRMTIDRWQLPPATPATGQKRFQQWLQSLAHLKTPVPTGLAAADYIDVIEGAVDYFSSHQDASGAIIDPFRNQEFQYSTPCFAFAASLVASVRGKKEHLAAAVAAFSKAAADLSGRKAADGHEDFYPAPLAHAYRLLSKQISPETLASISAPLRIFDPYAIYRKPPGGRGGSGSNWNCVALAGHMLLNVFGARDDQVDMQYVEESLLAQGGFFNNPNGNYMEGPSTYDLFPRVWLADMLAAGYVGARAASLRDALDRSAQASLFMQSPTGEWICGGRSAQHTWADALQCALFEIAAKDAMQSGDKRKGGVYKRAARRALASVRAWRRPSGELYVVKNKYDPAMRHGFETYTSHSQYNLLALTALGYAYEHSLATENSVEELMTPAEASVGILKLEAPMGLLCAQAAGTQAVILTEPKHGQNPAGLARIQFLDVASQLAQTDSLVATPLYHLPGENGHNVCAGLSWLKVASGDAVTSEHLSVADMRSDHGSCSLVDVVEMKESLKFGIEWQLSKQPIKRIAETYMLSRGCLRVDYTWDGNLSEGQVQFPVFSGDGNAKANIEVGQDSVVVAFSGSRIRYRLDGTRMPVCVHENLVSRTGTVSVFAASITGDRATLLVEVL